MWSLRNGVVKEIKVIQQPNAMHDCELDPFAIKDIIGTTRQTWLKTS